VRRGDPSTVGWTGREECPDEERKNEHADNDEPACRVVSSRCEHVFDSNSEHVFVSRLATSRPRPGSGGLIRAAEKTQVGSVGVGT
jgi:hypothetical protein